MTSPRSTERGQPDGMALIATIVGVAWAGCSAWLFVRGIAVKEGCSAAIASDGLTRSPCDLVGWLQVVAVAGGWSVWLIATVSSAWRSKILSVLAATLSVGLPALGWVALRSFAFP